mmetsp:Transcript_1659/g.3461  ORF Transcript_1659/g.3461 Transcript_1659/m.3461 type:complete len:107 (-) Transcript_1659:813-1133(-)
MLLAFPPLWCKAGIVAAIIILVHATICAIQHREYLKAVEQPFTYAPMEITAQCVAALVLATWGVLGLQAKFVPIRTTTHLAKQTVDSLDPPDFVHLNTRKLRGAAA